MSCCGFGVPCVDTPCSVAASVFRRLQNTSSWTDSEAECRDAVCLACSQRRCGESPHVKLQRLFHPASEKKIVRDVTEKRLIHRVFIATQCPNRLPQRRRLFAISQRNVCYIVFSSRHRAQIDCRREHRVFIATQSPNRLPQRRRLFVMSQRNVCYIVFSSRHRAHVAEHARRCLVSPTLETTSPACFRFSTCGFSVRFPTAAVSMNSPSASRLSSAHWGILS